MLRLTALAAVVAVCLVASPATAFMTKCQRSCVGKPYSPTCVAWTFEGSRSAVFENGCFANCMLQEDPTAHITQRDVKLPEACAKEYAEYGYWLGDIKACFLCPPPTDTSDSLPQAEASDSNSLIHEPLEAEGHSLGTAHLDAEPLSMGDGDDDAEEDQALANVETRGLIVEPIATGTEEGQVAPQLIVEPVDDEEEPQGQPGGRRLARRLLA